MKKIFTLLLISILMFSCSNDDDGEEIDCALFDPMVSSLLIRLVDQDGTNLIENGTINPENITVEGNFPNPDFQYLPPREGIDSDDSTKYNHTLLLNIPYQSNFTYTINLNETESIDLEFDARLEELPCEVSFFIPTKLTYEGQEIKSENGENSEFNFLAEIEIK
ncbi:hypothetical protein [Galbibacter mesophilus]|uniref:hypothetical protein n=1 Tax=Galbibacter mesophilus TaxID=379069 RepID=UPI00191E456C|nr:hypothetical protein [Galbibacter mesophilus]MCM5663774.1 hypothetical protein [Galbibacter mesophilus]